MLIKSLFTEQVSVVDLLDVRADTFPQIWTGGGGGGG